MMERKAKISELRQLGRTYASIAELYGVSRQRIQQIMTELPRKGKKARAEHRKWKLSCPQWYKLQARAANNKIKVAVLYHYGKGDCACVKCGFRDIRALSIDHIEGNGNKHRKEDKLSGTSLYRWLMKNNFPEGYQTLCMNCQWIKKAENNEY